MKGASVPLAKETRMLLSVPAAEMATLIGHSNQPVAPSHVWPTRPMFWLSFFLCSDKKHKAIFSLASHWFSHSLSFYFPTFITFEVTNLIVLTLSILTVGKLRICKLMFKSFYKWTPVFTCTAGLELSNVWLSCCAKMWTTPREQKRKLSFISTMSFFGFSFIFGTQSSGKWWQFVPLQDFCIIHDAPWLPLNAEVNFH